MSDVLNQRMEAGLDKLDALLVQHNQYLNGGDTEYMTTELGIDVPTVAHQARLQQEAAIDLNDFVIETADHLDQQLPPESGA